VPKKKGGVGMNLLKIGAVVVGGIVVFFLLDAVVHVLLGLILTLAFVAIVAYKVIGSNRRREIRRGGRY
jgi:uncharacterized membrane protein YjgN (DUF898 family)